MFGAGLALLAILYFRSKVSHVTLFWAAFILTRPLGATVGDWFDKPVAKGGLDMSRPAASAVLIVLILALIMFLPQRPRKPPGPGRGSRVRLALLVGALVLARAVAPPRRARKS